MSQLRLFLYRTVPALPAQGCLGTAVSCHLRRAHVFRIPCTRYLPALKTPPGTVHRPRFLCRQWPRENRFGPPDPNTDLHFGSRMLLETWTWRREGSKAAPTQKLFYFVSVSEQPCFNVFTLSFASHTWWVEGGLLRSQGICKQKVCSRSSFLLPRERREKQCGESRVPRAARGKGLAGTLPSAWHTSPRAPTRAVEPWAQPLLRQSCVLGRDSGSLN